MSGSVARGRVGHTLVELLTAVTISSMLLVGLASAVSITLKSLSISQTSAQVSVQAAQILDQFATELQSAIYVYERTASVIGFTVPDQNNDGYAERVRYAWTGAAGGALTRQFNGAAPQTLAASVDLFTLTPAYQSVAETYPSVGIEDAAESLLIDYNGTGGLANNNVTLVNWFGQHFTYGLPAGAYAWRPTTIRFMGRKGSIPGTTFLQMRQANANLMPTSTVLEQYTVLDTGLGSSYAWMQQSYSSLPPLPSGGGICFVLQGSLGITATMTAQSTGDYSRLVKTTNSGGAWSLDNGHSLVCQLYGKLTRSSTTQTVNSNYLTSMGVSLRMTSTSPTLQSTPALLNHPEMLSGLWELKFDQNPTTVDINGDAAMDFVLNGGGAFNPATVSGGAWHASAAQLNTNPGSDFAKTTIVDVRMQNTSVGGSGAVFTINCLRSGANCVPLSASLALQSDGTQTLTLAAKTSNAVTKTLMSIAGLPAQPVLVHLAIDPAISAVSMNVNGVERGTYAITPFASADASRIATIAASGSNADFSYFRVRVLEQ